MLKHTRQPTSKLGAAPGIAKYVGEKKDFSPFINHFVFDEFSVEQRVIQNESTPQLDLPADKYHLVEVCGLHNSTLVESIGNTLGLHALAIEDILNTGQRPKMEEIGEYIFITIQNIQYDKLTATLTQEHISIVCSHKGVFVFTESDTPVFGNIQKRLQNPKSRIRTSDPLYLCIALLDAIVDNYDKSLRELSEDIEYIEEGMSQSISEEILLQLYTVRRLLLTIRNTTAPVKQLLHDLETNEIIAPSEFTSPFLSDVKDHLNQALDTVGTLHDMLGSMLDLHISLAEMNMNNAMRFLTVIATMFIPLTFIAGIYGMNFSNMPELQWKWGYGFVLLLMLSIACVLIYYFKKRRWL